MTDEQKENPTQIVSDLDDLAKMAGTRMPKMVATGDLTVENKTDKPAETVQHVVDDKAELPAIGTKFMIAGQEFIVVYHNEGQKRFSAQPCKGVY